MPLLTRANTEFRVAVTRSGPHYKSGRLDRLLAALTDFQDNPGDAAKLRYLYKRLYRWIEENPKEMKHRGGAVGRLKEEIEAAATRLHANVNAERAEFARITNAWSTANTSIVRIQGLINANAAAWGGIQITDQPTGIPGQYNFTPGNVFAEGDRNIASQQTDGDQKQRNPEYWLRLGKRVLTPQRDGNCYGRCFSCAAAVIYTLVMDAHFDNYMIEHVGATDYDHHLVLVGRDNANGVDDTGLNGGRREWMTTAIIIDVWQANLNGNQHFASVAYQNPYAQGNLRFFCAFPPSRRATDRGFATNAPTPAREVAARVDIAAAARAQIQDQGRPTRNVRNPHGRGWIVEEEVAPGVWQVVG